MAYQNPRRKGKDMLMRGLLDAFTRTNDDGPLGANVPGPGITGRSVMGNTNAQTSTRPDEIRLDNGLNKEDDGFEPDLNPSDAQDDGTEEPETFDLSALFTPRSRAGQPFAPTAPPMPPQSQQPTPNVPAEAPTTPRFAPDGPTYPQDAPLPPSSRHAEEQVAAALDIARKKKPSAPPLMLPYANPQTPRERLENQLAQAEYDADHPRNRDRGIKGFLGELASNFFEGLRYAQPGMSFWQSLGMGGLGAGLGAANRSWNERRRAEEMVPVLRGRLQDEYGRERAALEQQKTAADIEANAEKQAQQRILNDPVLRIAISAKEITQEMADSLNERFGLKLSPKYWGQYIHRVDPITGKLKTAKQTSPEFTENVTISPALQNVPGTLNVGGQQYVLPQRDIVNALISQGNRAADVAERTRNRAADVAERTRTRTEQRAWEAAKINTAAMNDYAEKLRKWQGEQAQLRSRLGIAGQPARDARTAQLVQRLRATADIAAAAAEGSPTVSFAAAQKDFDAAYKELMALQQQVAEEQRKAGATQAQLDALAASMPQPPEMLTPPGRSKRARKQ